MSNNNNNNNRFSKNWQPEQKWNQSTSRNNSGGNYNNNTTRNNNRNNNTNTSGNYNGGRNYNNNTGDNYNGGNYNNNFRNNNSNFNSPNYNNSGNFNNSGTAWSNNNDTNNNFDNYGTNSSNGGGSWGSTQNETQNQIVTAKELYKIDVSDFTNITQMGTVSFRNIFYRQEQHLDPAVHFPNGEISGTKTFGFQAPANLRLPVHMVNDWDNHWVLIPAVGEIVNYPDNIILFLKAYWPTVLQIRRPTQIQEDAALFIQSYLLWQYTLYKNCNNALTVAEPMWNVVMNYGFWISCTLSIEEIITRVKRETEFESRLIALLPMWIDFVQNNKIEYIERPEENPWITHKIMIYYCFRSWTFIKRRMGFVSSLNDFMIFFWLYSQINNPMEVASVFSQKMVDKVIEMKESFKKYPKFPPASVTACLQHPLFLDGILRNIRFSTDLWMRHRIQHINGQPKRVKTQIGETVLLGNFKTKDKHSINATSFTSADENINQRKRSIETEHEKSPENKIPKLSNSQDFIPVEKGLCKKEEHDFISNLYEKPNQWVNVKDISQYKYVPPLTQSQVQEEINFQKQSRKKKREEKTQKTYKKKEPTPDYNAYLLKSPDGSNPNWDENRSWNEDPTKKEEPTKKKPTLEEWLAQAQKFGYTGYLKEEAIKSQCTNSFSKDLDSAMSNQSENAVDNLVEKKNENTNSNETNETSMPMQLEIDNDGYQSQEDPDSKKLNFNPENSKVLEESYFNRGFDEIQDSADYDEEDIDIMSNEPRIEHINSYLNQLTKEKNATNKQLKAWYDCWGCDEILDEKLNEIQRGYREALTQNNEINKQFFINAFVPLIFKEENVGYTFAKSQKDIHYCQKHEHLRFDRFIQTSPDYTHLEKGFDHSEWTNDATINSYLSLFMVDTDDNLNEINKFYDNIATCGHYASENWKADKLQKFTERVWPFAKFRENSNWVVPIFIKNHWIVAIYSFDEPKKPVIELWISKPELFDKDDLNHVRRRLLRIASCNRHAVTCGPNKDKFLLQSGWEKMEFRKKIMWGEVGEQRGGECGLVIAAFLRIYAIRDEDDRKTWQQLFTPDQIHFWNYHLNRELVAQRFLDLDAKDLSLFRGKTEPEKKGIIKVTLKNVEEVAIQCRKQEQEARAERKQKRKEEQAIIEAQKKAEKEKAQGHPTKPRGRPKGSTKLKTSVEGSKKLKTPVKGRGFKKTIQGVAKDK